MTNFDYLGKVKKENLDYKIFKEVCEHEIEYRKMKALEIIAETLINIYNKMCSEVGINVDARVN